jgi:hypothetical protein
MTPGPYTHTGEQLAKQIEQYRTISHDIAPLPETARSADRP